MATDLVQQFEKLWESNDSSPDVFEFLEQHLGSSAGEILAVLLADQSRRWKTELPLSVDDYLDGIPRLKSIPDAKVQLVGGELQAKQGAYTVSGVGDVTSDFPEFDGTSSGESIESISIDSGFELRTDVESASFANVDQHSETPKQLGRYRLVRVLGEGAFGRIFLAFDEELERQVAIKVPKPERFKKPEDAEAYLAEARIVARLSHPNIVPVYDTGRIEDGSIYVVSKFIEGCTLADRFKQSRPSPEEAAELLATVALALDHAHQKGLIHRDVKPGNILLEESTNTPYVADFGLAISEENYQKEHRISGTPAYMSPEQARGEGHRLDRRSDVFSVGMVLFELLTGKKPFQASTTTELLHKIIADEPPYPRELDHSIPAELERICLKAMSKRASDRYATAAELAEDLLHWQHDPEHENNELQIVPKGLRSFDAGDAEFFLSLLPGPRNRNGLPDSIEFWKRRIEEVDADETFSVGLIYGPSGCGKSSLVKAGLLPRLSHTVTTVYVEATPEETEIRILRGLRKQIPELPQDLNLLQTLSLLRRGEQNRKVVIIVDQFEQWLHAFRSQDGTELVAALRQCDGGRLQAIVMVRDDFAMAAARFMNAIDIFIVQGENFATVDLFDVDHARKVIIKFGQAFGKLPEHSDELTVEQQNFVTTVASGLAQDGKVISVRLALFAEMVKGKSWVPITLDEVGGTRGIGVNFLEETFASRTANPKHRLHQQAARNVLSALLPEIGSDIKGHMRSHAALLEASGYQNQTEDFNELLRILDGELRLITPTDPAGFQSEGGDPSSKFYQLTHDYLVSPLRGWLTRKQIETRKGRAELKLAERAALWNAKPENRHLPSFLEWANIRMLTDYRKSSEQRKLMQSASRYYGIRFGIVAVATLALVFAGLTIRNSVNKSRLELVAQKRQEQSDAEATRIVEGLLQADSSQIKTIIEKNLPDYRQWAEDDLSAAFANLPDNDNGKLHAALAILPSDNSVLPFLQKRLLTVSPYQFDHVRTLLDDHKGNLIADYWEIAKDLKQDDGIRFQAACALASYDSANSHWQDESFRDFMASHLVGVLPSDLVPWRNVLSPVKKHLTDPLAAIYRSETKGEQVRSFATDTLADYLSDDAEGLFDLLADSSQKQFGTMFDKLDVHRERAVELGNKEFASALPVDANDDAKEARAIRQANAGVMLLRMNAPDQIWPKLKHSPDPLVRSYLVNWLLPRGGDASKIIDQYQQEKDVTIKRALLLTLGNFDESCLPEADRNAFFESLLTEYLTDSDAGLHGALGWLLRKCGREKQVAAIDKDLQQSEAELLEKKDDQRNWYVNGRGQTFVVLDAEGEFEMGSSEEATDHAADEDLHMRKIGRRFAIASMEVTVANWREFNASVGGGFPPDHEQLKRYILTEDSPMMAITWYEAVDYCNWLSEQEGIPEEEWCYETNEDGAYGPGMYAKENFLECSGYRLPTESEWEFASRAGAKSSRHFGSTAALLTEYAWYQANSNHHVHPVALLKPNDFGLFDMYGNAYEWCYDQYLAYPIDSDSDEPVADDPETPDVTNEQRRILRGGSFRNLPPTARSASRVADPPTARVLNFGLRPVRTMN